MNFLCLHLFECKYDSQYLFIILCHMISHQIWIIYEGITFQRKLKSQTTIDCTGYKNSSKFFIYKYVFLSQNNSIILTVLIEANKIGNSIWKENIMWDSRKMQFEEIRNPIVSITTGNLKTTHLPFMPLS